MDESAQDREIARAPAMEGAEVRRLYDLLEEHGIEIWLDGGWGIDALLGEQTRPHGDLDIAVHHADVPRLRELLEARGYLKADRSDATPWNFVLVDDAGHEVDVHSFTHDDAGNLTYGIAYPVEALAGEGRLQDRPVRCIALESVIAFHSTYEPRPRDVEDMRRLHEHFAVALPRAYQALLSTAPDAVNAPHETEAH
jgi:lincosamide nucleotidyltransferase A/C/D/E